MGTQRINRRICTMEYVCTYHAEQTADSQACPRGDGSFGNHCTIEGPFPGGVRIWWTCRECGNNALVPFGQWPSNCGGCHRAARDSGSRPVRPGDWKVDHWQKSFLAEAVLTVWEFGAWETYAENCK